MMRLMDFDLLLQLSLSYCLVEKDDRGLPSFSTYSTSQDIGGLFPNRCGTSPYGPGLQMQLQEAYMPCDSETFAWYCNKYQNLMYEKIPVYHHVPY